MLGYFLSQCQTNCIQTNHRLFMFFGFKQSGYTSVILITQCQKNCIQTHHRLQLVMLQKIFKVLASKIKQCGYKVVTAKSKLTLDRFVSNNAVIHECDIHHLRPDKSQLTSNLTLGGFICGLNKCGFLKCGYMIM